MPYTLALGCRRIKGRCGFVRLVSLTGLIQAQCAMHSNPERSGFGAPCRGFPRSKSRDIWRPESQNYIDELLHAYIK